VTYYPAHSDFCHEISRKADAASAAAEDDYFQRQLEDFVRAIQTGSEPRVSGERGLDSVALMEQCYQMATPLEEPWVDVPLERLKEILPSDARPTTVRSAATIAVS
jgi:hypothetical protein